MVEQLPENAVGVVRARPDADAVGGAVGAARRPRARRARGQPLPEPRGQGHQRPARRARRTIVEAMGCEVATPDDAREILDLKPRS